MSRAYRWRFLLEPMGYKPRFWNSFFAVMIGYIMNLVFPRAGEASRAAALTRYEGVKFEKSFGTILAERAIDMIILLGITFFTIFLQFSLLRDGYVKIRDYFLSMLTLRNGIILIALLAVFVFGLYILFKRLQDSPLVNNIKNMIRGFGEGLQTIFTMKGKWKFFLHTFLIWGLYVAMYWICFFAIPETANVPMGGVFAGFVFGSFAIVLVPGGIGAYPAAVMQSLLLYGISKDSGFALGWIIWLAQTLMIIGLGGMSMFLMPRLNKKWKHVATSPSVS